MTWIYLFSLFPKWVAVIILFILFGPIILGNFQFYFNFAKIFHCNSSFITLMFENFFSLKPYQTYWASGQNLKAIWVLEESLHFLFEEYKDMYVNVCKLIYLFAFIIFKGFIPFNIHLTYLRLTIVWCFSTHCFWYLLEYIFWYLMIILSTT